MSFSLQHFELTEMLRCGRELGRAAMGSPSLEEAARRVVRYLYDGCVDAETGERECVLVRFFITQPYRALDDELQGVVCGQMGCPPEAETGERECVLVRFFITQPYRALDDELQGVVCGQMGCPPEAETMNCLVLLASAGDEPEWNDRRSSRGHQAIPLPDEHRVAEVPMIAELFRSLGVDAHALVNRGPDLLRTGTEGKMYRVFFVPEAEGSPYIPSQEEFVEPHGIRSVLGWGGVLHGGELFAVVLFTRVAIPEASADRFRHVALDVKAAISLIPNTFEAPPAALA